MSRLFEDILDNLEKPSVPVSRKMADGEEPRDWPDNRKYKVAFTFYYYKYVTVREMKLLIEKAEFFLSVDKRIDDYSFVCLENNDYMTLNLRFDEQDQKKKQPVWIKFSFTFNGTSLRSALRFIEDVYKAFNKLSDFSIYDNDYERLNNTTSRQIKLEPKDLECLFKMNAGKILKGINSTKEKEDKIFRHLLSLGEIFFSGKESLPEECIDICRGNFNPYEYYLTQDILNQLNQLQYRKTQLLMPGETLEKKIQSSRISFSRLEQIRDYMYFIRFLLVAKSRDENATGREWIKKALEKNPLLIKEYRIIYSMSARVVCFAGILEFITTNIEGITPNVAEITFFQTIPLKYGQESFINIARSVVDEFDTKDYKYLREQCVTI